MNTREPKKIESYALLVSISSLVFGLLAGAILMALMGSNPFVGYKYLFTGGVMNSFQVGNTLAIGANLTLVGLSVAFALKGGLYNIGSTGQMLVGGMCASLVAQNFSFLPRPLYLALLILSALLGGSVWGIIPGFLKAIFKVHEVLSTMLMNWIAYWSVSYMLLGKEHVDLGKTLHSSVLSRFFGGSSISLLFFVAIVAVIIIAFILYKTTLGFKVKTVGSNRRCAEYAGINVNLHMILTLMISGGLAGLAGLSCNFSVLQDGMLPSLGFEGIAVALLASGNPLGVLFSSLFFGLLQSGKVFMNSMTGIPLEIVDTVVASVVYFSVIGVLSRRLWGPLVRKLSRGTKVAEETEQIKEVE